MTLKQMLQVLWARQRLFWLIAGSIVALVVLVSLILPKTYVAQVSVVVDSKSTDPVSGMEKASDLMPSNIATQTDVITSHNVALKVVDRLRLYNNQELREKYQEVSEGAGSIKDWIADQLLRNVEVKPSRESHVIDVEVAAGDPAEAAEIANALADAYIQTSLELKMEPARRQTAWFQEQLQGLRKSLETAQGRLSDYQRTHNVVGTNEQIDIENGRLAEMSTQLLAAQGAMYEARTHQKQMQIASQQDRLKALPDVMANPLLQGMKADLARAEGKLAETGERYGRNHPEYVSAAAEVRALQAKLSAEIETATRAIEQTAQQSAAQVAELTRALDTQRDHILQLKRQRDEVDLLRREVDSSQRVYDAALQRATQVRLESQLDQSNIAILNPAVVPIKAARPRLVLNTLVAIVGGSLIAAASVLIVESMDRRVRTSGDLVEIAGVVVLAEVPRKSGRRRRRRALPASSTRALAVRQP